MVNFNIGDICRIDNSLQKKHGREFEIIGFVYDKTLDMHNHFPCRLKVRYLDTNRKGTYSNSFDSLVKVGESENPNKKDIIEVLHY